MDGEYGLEGIGRSEHMAWSDGTLKHRGDQG
jgi:hypothetical protein